MPRQVRQHRFPLGLACLGVAFARGKHLGTGLVQILAKIKAARLAACQSTLAAADRPAGEDLGKARDILLRYSRRSPRAYAAPESRAPDSR